MSAAATESTDLVPFTQQSYVARRNFWNFLGIKCRILASSGDLLYYVKLKAFKLKEDITVYRDRGMTEPLLGIKARQIIDFAAAYDVVDLTTDEKVGAFKRKGWRSILRDEWQIMGANDEVIGRIIEDSQLLAFLRRFLSNLIPQNYTVEVDGQPVGEFRGTWNPFIVKYSVLWQPDSDQGLDPRMGVAAAVLLMTIEGKQG